jgi:hypothetical protein
MNVLKNFEAVFVVALGVAASASYFVQSADATETAAAQTLSVATPSRMAVVTVAGKRMSAIEKQRSLEDERRLAKSSAATGSRS